MSKKKQQKNGFFYFMLDMQEELRQRGRNVPMRSMSAIAGPKWATMTDAQRQSYNHRAKVEKAIVRGNAVSSVVTSSERLDCTGQKLSVSWYVRYYPAVHLLWTVEKAVCKPKNDLLRILPNYACSIILLGTSWSCVGDAREKGKGESAD